MSKISGRGIRHLEGLTKLGTLVIWDNVDDEGMRSIGRLSWITNLSVKSYGVTDEGFRHIERLTQLRRLELEYSSITDASFAQVAKYRQLAVLHVGGARVIGHGLVHLKGLPITDLQVQVQEVDERVIGTLEGLLNLSTLGLTAPTITGENVRRIAGIKGLSTLQLFGAPLSDDSLRHLIALTNLNTLMLEQVQLSDAAISRLRALKSLGTLRLSHPVIRTKDAEAKLRAALPKCLISIDDRTVK